MIRRRVATARRGAGLVGVLLLAVGCGAGPGGVRERFDDSRVEVEIHVERSADAWTLVATFRPTSPDLHLYGADLPRDGIDGAGRPTRLDIMDAGWSATGPLSAAPGVALVAIAGFDQPFPIYPDGPVTLRQAIAPGGGSDDGRVDVEVTFMACSTAGLCYLPQIRHRMTVPAA